MDGVISELYLALTKCRAHMTLQSEGSRALAHLAEAASRIEQALKLLKSVEFGRPQTAAHPSQSSVPSVSKPKLPPCSVPNCEGVAGAIVKAQLLCGEHALEQFKILRHGRMR